MTSVIELSNGGAITVKDDARVVAEHIVRAANGDSKLPLVYVVPANGNLGVYIAWENVVLVREMPQ